MKIVFVDEIQQTQKNNEFFGVGAIIIDSAFYKDFKAAFQKSFQKLGWDGNEEFKGKYLFSQKGDDSVPIDKRIDFVREIVKISTVNTYARYSFVFSYNFASRSEENYMQLLSKIIKSIPTSSNLKRDKPVVMVIYDNCDEFDIRHVDDAILKNLKKGLVLFERSFCIGSDNRTCGIVTVDILSYLKSWIELSSDKVSMPETLFSNVGKRDTEKLAIIQEIMANIKNIKVIK